MPRSLVFGNQSTLICFDKDYNIRDLYYPHVGMDNHINGHKCRFGVWVDDNFSWIESDQWEKRLNYLEESLVGYSSFENPSLKTKIKIKECVYHKKNIFIRFIEIENKSNKDREYRLFFTQDFQIYGTDVGITAYYDDITKSIIHYLKDRWFLFNGKGADDSSIDSFATGKSHFEKAKGTYKDAEDGKLSENAIEQGSVDSTIQINVNVKSDATSFAEYWICIGKNYEEVEDLNKFITNLGIQNAINEELGFDRAWANKSDFDFFDLPKEVINLFKQSILVVKSQMDNDGAIIAANDSDILQFNKDHYSYMWPRDGAFIAWAMDKSGYAFLTRAFFKFCSRVISEKGYLLHKYNPDGSIGSSWHPWFRKGEGVSLAIQEDETALVIFVLWQHYREYKDLELISELYFKFIKPAANFLLEFRSDNGLPLPSYDIWEERRGIHTFTVCSVIAGLKAAAKFAEIFKEDLKVKEYLSAAEKMKNAMITYLYDKNLERFLRTINFQKDGTIEKDTTIDASLFALFEFEIFPSINEKVVSTMTQIEKKLWVNTECGGLARYENDYYHRISQDTRNVPGNPWYICTLWLADWYLDKVLEGEKEGENLQKALNLIKWVKNHSLDSGLLAEQVNPHNSNPLSVSPLTWSHGTFIMTVLKYLEAYSVKNKCEKCGRALDIFSHDGVSAFFKEKRGVTE